MLCSEHTSVISNEEQMAVNVSISDFVPRAGDKTWAGDHVPSWGRVLTYMLL